MNEIFLHQSFYNHVIFTVSKTDWTKQDVIVFVHQCNTHHKQLPFIRSTPRDEWQLEIDFESHDLFFLTAALAWRMALPSLAPRFMALLATSANWRFLFSVFALWV